MAAKIAQLKVDVGCFHPLRFDKLCSSTSTLYYLLDREVLQFLGIH